MKFVISYIISICLFTASCDFAKQGPETASNVVTHEEHQHNDDLPTIELDNGEKWKVDANMLTHIRNMENDVHSFAIVERKDYILFAEKLQSNINLLTSNCTMEGKAHDELHKWLLPFIDLVNELSETTDDIVAAKQFENIQGSFRIFNKYFK